MDNSQALAYANEAELEKIWMDGYQKVMAEARNSETTAIEYQKQQDLYSKYAALYDDALKLEKFSGPRRIAEKLNELYKQKDIKILDFGCGTGLVADACVSPGFTNIDGIDSNQKMLDIAEKKGNMKKYLLGKDDDGFKDIPSNTYDVVCASGVFFLSASHPGFDCLEEICRVTKSKGKIILLVKNAYLSQPYVKFDVVEKLESDGVLKANPKELFEGYRKPFEFETDDKSVGAFLIYDVC